MLAVTNTSRTININQTTTVKCVHTLLYRAIMMMDFNIPTRVLTAPFIKAINVVVSHVYRALECVERISFYLQRAYEIR